MPTQFEDTISGGTDISGDPQPGGARAPHHIAAGAKGKVNRQKQQQGQNPLEGIGKAVSGAAQSAEKAVTGSQAFQDRPFQDLGLEDLNLNPINWTQQQANDAGMVWSFARQAYKTLSGRYHDGVGNLFQQNDAMSHLAQMGATSAIDNAIPILGLKERSQEAMAMAGAAKAGKDPGTDPGTQEQVKGAEEGAVQDAPGAAADLLSMAGPGALGKAAMVGFPLAEQLLGGNQDEQHSAIAWAAVGSLLTFGHVPEPVRKVLQSRFANWGAFEKAIGVAQDLKEKAGRAGNDPEKQAQQIKDFIAHQLEQGPMPSVTKTLATPAEHGQLVSETYRTSEGELKQLASKVVKDRQKTFSKLGVSSTEELVEKVQENNLTGKAAELVRKNWKLLGLPYDLRYWAPGEAPPRDPHAPISEIQNQDLSGRVTTHMGTLNHYLQEIHSGLFATSRDPGQAILRALAGHSRVTDLVHQDYMVSMHEALKDWGVNEANGKLLMKAAEGDQEVYKSLPPEARSVVDGWGLVRSALRQQSAGTDYAKRFQPNWVPRLEQLRDVMPRGRPSRGALLARERRRSRATALQVDQEGHLFMGQHFNTVQESNQALQQSQQKLYGELMNPERELRGEYQHDPEALEIRKLLKTDPEQADARAKQLAQDHYGLKSEDFFSNVGRAAGYQARSVKTQQALNELAKTKIQARHPSGQTDVVQMAAVKPESERQAEEMLKQGYVRMEDPKFAGFLIAGKRTPKGLEGFAGDLQRYIAHVSDTGLSDNAAVQVALKTERQMVRAIMYSPAPHGMNIAGRMGVLSFAHPLETVNRLKKGFVTTGLPSRLTDEEAYQLRREAIHYGVMPHRKGKGWQDQHAALQQDAMGDVEEGLHPKVDDTKKLGRMLGAIKDSPPVRAYGAIEDFFWANVHDFGVNAFHIEKEAALAKGMDETAAGLWAARRANSWMGMVTPEDTNPIWQQISRGVMFAPNWWRTAVELMVPVYKRSGLFENDKMARYAAGQAMKTVAAAYAWQKVTGNLLNLMLSGHLQYENQDGAKDKIEVTAPWVPGDAVDPKTGARRTMENPFARQPYDFEQAAGFQSGHPDTIPQSQDVWDGMVRFSAGRLSPLLNSTAALANIDLYHTLTSGFQPRGILQGQQVGSPSPLSVLAALIYSVPGASQFGQDMQRQVQDPNTPQTSLFGTQVPSSLGDYAKDAGDVVSRMALSALIGVNSPYPYAEKTRGKPLSDQDYQRAKQAQDDYQKQMQALSAEAMSGQMTPGQWRNAYQTLSAKHSAEMKSFFQDAPQYVNGSSGMANDWEKLYETATNPDGTVNHSQLTELQAKFQHEHTPEQMQAMKAVLRQNDSKYAMLAFYHNTIDALDKWQEHYAADKGIDVTTLRQQVDGYNALYGDSQQQQKYIQQHPEFRAYRQALRAQFEQTPVGMAYSMFHGNSAAVMRYLGAHHITQEDLMAEAEKEAQAA